jgi:hypothetical protein
MKFMFNSSSRISERKVKIKVVTVCTTKEYRGSEVQLHSFFTSAVDGGEWSTSRLGYFMSGKEPRYPVDWRRGGPQKQSGCCEAEKNILALPEFEPRIVQPVA